MAKGTWQSNVSTVFMDLSKAYDCILHDLMIAKLEAYGLDKLVHIC